MTMPFNLLHARRRLHLSLEQQQLLLADEVQRAHLNAAQLRRSLVHSATSPLSLGLAAVVGFLGTRKLLSPPAPRPVVAEESQPQPARRSTLIPLLINLLTPTVIGWISERLLPLIHREEVPPPAAAPEEDRAPE